MTALFPAKRMCGKVLLVNPRLGYFDRAKYPPLGIIALASFIERHGYEVDVMDAQALNLSNKETVDEIISSGADFCGFGFMTSQADAVAAMIKEVKKIKPSVIVMAGGVHVSVVPEDFLKKCPEVDYVVIGEGEYTLRDLLNALRDGRETDTIPGIGYVKDDNIIITPPRERIGNLDELPVPAWSKVPVERYEVVTPERVSEPSAGGGLTLSSERGCPFKCVFCASGGVYGKVYREKSPERIVEEIKYIVNTYGIRNFFFVDEVLTFKESTINKLCDLITVNGLKIRWSCNSRCNSQGLNTKTIAKMKSAGCIRVDLGTESGSPRILKSIRKGISLEDIYKAHRIVHDAGLYITTLMMTGFIDETMEDFKSSLKMLLFLESEVASFGAATPFPGTELYATALEKGYLRVEKDEWSEFYIANRRHILRTDHFDYDQVVELNDYANHVCYVITRLSAFKRHGIVTLMNTAKLYASLLTGNIFSRFSFSQCMLWIKLFLYKRNKELYIDRQIQSLHIRSENYLVSWDHLCRDLPASGVQLSFLIMCLNGASGLDDLKKLLDDYYDHELRIQICRRAGREAKNNQFDIVFYYSERTGILDLLRISFHCIHNRMKGKAKISIFVNGDLKFWRFDLKAILALAIDRSLHRLLLPFALFELLCITYRTKEMFIRDKIMPRYLERMF